MLTDSSLYSFYYNFFKNQTVFFFSSKSRVVPFQIADYFHCLQVNRRKGSYSSTQTPPWQAQSSRRLSKESVCPHLFQKETAPLVVLVRISQTITSEASSRKRIKRTTNNHLDSIKDSLKTDIVDMAKLKEYHSIRAQSHFRGRIK